MQGVFLDECMFWMDMPIMFRKVMKKTEYLSGTKKLLFFLKYRGKTTKAIQLGSWIAFVQISFEKCYLRLSLILAFLPVSARK